MQTLRGFDEQSIRLANYAISTMSYHYYYQQNSSLEGFVNYGTGNRINEFDRHHYLGFGLAFTYRYGKWSIFNELCAW